MDKAAVIRDLNALLDMFGMLSLDTIERMMAAGEAVPSHLKAFRIAVRAVEALDPSDRVFDEEG